VLGVLGEVWLSPNRTPYSSWAASGLPGGVRPDLLFAAALGAPGQTEATSSDAMALAVGLPKRSLPDLGPLGECSESITSSGCVGATTAYGFSLVVFLHVTDIPRAVDGPAARD